MTNLHNGEKETERKIEKNEGIKDEERERQRRKVLKKRQTDLHKSSEDAVESKYEIDHRRCITVKQYRGV